MYTLFYMYINTEMDNEDKRQVNKIKWNDFWFHTGTSKITELMVSNKTHT